MKVEEPIVIYKSPNGESVLEIKIQGETLWLTQKQMALLFGTEVPAVSKHIVNIYKTGELDKSATLSRMEIVQKEGERVIKRKLDHYNLDMIISIGYRINSVRGTQFRIWANKILKDYLLEGYAINKKKLEAAQEKLSDLKKALELLEHVTNQTLLSSDEATGLVRVMTDYVFALDILDQYDHQTLAIRQISTNENFRITYPEAI
ncbi:MAG: virulence RhuM family protein, partial [Saprospiraceae bacterium]|nr:virulence RhuM family protein [Saprospiraceae bacterium]